MIKISKFSFFAIAFIYILSLVSCQNSEKKSKTKSIIETESINTQDSIDLVESLGVHTSVFVGDDGNVYKLVFDTNTNPPTVSIQSNKLNIRLNQTEAWAKGAEYEGDNVSLTASGDNATLMLNNKRIKLLIKR